MEDNEEFFLKKEIESLKDENRQLSKKLGSKRYKLIDSVVDTAYKIVPKIPKRKKKVVKHKVSNKNRNFEKKRVDIINHNFYDWRSEERRVGKGVVQRVVVGGGGGG